MSGCIDSPLTVIPPNHRSNGNQGPTHLQTLATEKLTLTKTVSSKTPVANDGASEQRPESDPFDGLLEDFDVEDEGDRQVEEEVVAVGAPRTIPDEYLHTDPAVGLTVDEVVQRRKVYGSNRMNEENRSHVKQFLLFFVGPIQFVMEAACVLAGALKDWVDFGVIIGLLLLNAIVGFAQDFKAGNIVKASQR